MSIGITNPVEKYFKDGQWTFDGTVWRPQNQLLAYRTVVREGYLNADSAAGTITKNFTAVAAGEVLVIQSIVGYNVSTATSNLQFSLYPTGGGVVLDLSGYSAITRYLKYSNAVVLAETEYLRVVFGGVVLHDILYTAYCGYKFNIAE